MKINTKDKWIVVGILGAVTLTISWIYRKQIKSGAQSLSDFVSKLKNVAVNEWNYWKGGKTKEGNPETMDRLKTYWIEGAGIKNWTDKKMTDEAWSAAFISYVMKKSGAGKDWKYSPSHSTYIVDSIKNRKTNNANPFKGYKPQEVKLEIGDLVGKGRQGSVGYDTTGSYLSHTDIVIGFKDGYAETIGGNIGNSVSMTKVPITPDRKIDNSKVRGEKYFVVIKNKK